MHQDSIKVQLEQDSEEAMDPEFSACLFESTSTVAFVAEENRPRDAQTTKQVNSFANMRRVLRSWPKMHFSD